MADGRLSQEGSSFIRLDSKARLVLPLLLREGLGIAKGGPNEKAVGLKIVRLANGTATIKLSGSAEGANCFPFSKNGKEVR